MRNPFARFRRSDILLAPKLMYCGVCQDTRALNRQLRCATCGEDTALSPLRPWAGLPENPEVRERRKAFVEEITTRAVARVEVAREAARSSRKLKAVR